MIGGCRPAAPPRVIGMGPNGTRVAPRPPPGEWVWVGVGALPPLSPLPVGVWVCGCGCPLNKKRGNLRGGS